MKVGLVIERFQPERGGAEQWTYQFALRLLELGHEVHVVARRFSPLLKATPIVCHCPCTDRSKLQFAAAAEAYLRAMALDVIHDMGAGWYCNIFHPHGGSRLTMARVNASIAPRWIRPIKRMVDPLLPRIREFAAVADRQYADDGRLFVALSHRMADELVETHGVRREQIRLVYNGVNTQRFSPDNRKRYREAVRARLGVSPDTTLLLIVAHNFRLKGVPMLLRAMAAWDGPQPVHLVVVGGRHLRRYRWEIRRRGIGSRVSLVGVVDDTAPYYAAADVYVHPTFYDACSLGVLEAAASGLPSITTHINGASELLTQGVDAALIDNPADEYEFLYHLQSMLIPEVRAAMGSAARAMALRRTFAHNCDQMIAIYDEIAQRRRKRLLHKATGGREDVNLNLEIHDPPHSARELPVLPGVSRDFLPIDRLGGRAWKDLVLSGSSNRTDGDIR